VAGFPCIGWLIGSVPTRGSGWQDNGVLGGSIPLHPASLPVLTGQHVVSANYGPKQGGSMPRGESRSSRASHERPRSHHVFTIFSPRFHHVFQVQFRRLSSSNSRRPQPISRNETPNNRKLTTTHHKPRKRVFIHSQVVGPLLLTSVPSQKSPKTKSESKSQESSQKKKAPSSKGWGSRICRRSPNLPHTYACSTIGPTRLNFRVRDGNGCDPRSKLTGKLLKSRSRDLPQLNRLGVDVSNISTLGSGI
jgi:hypothetical protein